MTASTHRARNAAATRAAILHSARHAFAQYGYEGAGVRDIAAGAGVSAMLVNRYFGNKEGLFAEVLASVMAQPLGLTEQILTSATPGHDLARALVDLTAPGQTPLDGYLILLRSANSERAARIGRQQLEHHYQATLTDALPGDLAPQRAALLLALSAGLQVMRQVIGLTALTDLPPADLVRVIEPIIQTLFDEPQT